MCLENFDPMDNQVAPCAEEDNNDGGTSNGGETGSGDNSGNNNNGGSNNNNNNNNNNGSGTNPLPPEPFIGLGPFSSDPESENE